MVLRSLVDVEELILNVRSVGRVPRLELGLDVLPGSETLEIQTRLNLYTVDCGCRAGGAAAALGLVGYVSHLLLTVGGPTGWRVTHMVWGVTACLLAALAGKVLGIIHARARLVGELERLRERLQLLGR